MKILDLHNIYKKGENEYVIDTSLMGYQGYFATGIIRIKVAYDDNGRISAATHRTYFARICQEMGSKTRASSTGF